MERRVLIRHLNRSKGNQVEEFPFKHFKRFRELTIGRDPSCGVTYGIDQDDVSRHHAKIMVEREEPPEFSLTDLGSRNGTFINQQRIFGTSKLVPGDVVQVGFEGPEFRFELDPPIPAAGRPMAPVGVVGAVTRPPEPAATDNIGPEIWEIPRIGKGQHLDLGRIRVPMENFYLGFVYAATVIAVAALIAVAFLDIRSFLIVVAACLAGTLLLWISWQLFLAFLQGHAVRVGPNQYPQIHSLVTEASDVLGIYAPTVFILQGHGIFELFVARRFSRRGILMITSNMLDDLTEHRSSRELMFFIGRQLGLIATGYFSFWTIKHTIGQFSLFFYWAWQRRTHMTADRLGLLVAGDLYAAEQALLILTAGSGIAPSTNIQAIKEQRTELFDRFWAWIQLGLSRYPYMVDRIIRMREFAFEAARSGIQSNAPLAIGALPIVHRPIRSIPLMIVHGHDTGARLELENFLLKRFPHVTPITMIDKADSARTLPEKFERLASGVRGALAILTPDDLALARRTNTESLRARQNVIVEVGWFWGKFGRGKCLLLVRGNIEIPSDLSGIEVHRFVSSPTECSETLRDFIAELELT